MSLIATAKEIETLKKAAFAKIDYSRTNSPKMQVSASELISVCLAYEQAATGQYSTLEYNNQLMREQIEAMRNAFSEIVKLEAYGSEVYKIAEEFSW